MATENILCTPRNIFALYSTVHVCHYLLVIFLSTLWREINLHPYLLVWGFNTPCKLSSGVYWNHLVHSTICLRRQSWPDHIILIERHWKFFLHRVHSMYWANSNFSAEIYTCSFLSWTYFDWKLIVYTKIACVLIMCCGLDSRFNVREYW